MLMLRKLCPLRPGAYHVGVTKVPLLFFFSLALLSFSSTNFLMVVLLKYPLPRLTCHFLAQRTAVSQGGRLPAAGMQTGAHPPAGRAHPAALHAHVLHPETLLGLPQEDRGAAGAVPRLPHEVSQASFISILLLLFVVKIVRCYSTMKLM